MTTKLLFTPIYSRSQDGFTTIGAYLLSNTVTNDNSHLDDFVLLVQNDHSNGRSVQRGFTISLKMGGSTATQQLVVRVAANARPGYEAKSARLPVAAGQLFVILVPLPARESCVKGLIDDSEVRLHPLGECLRTPKKRRMR
jgi:hypothetical protein